MKQPGHNPTDWELVLSVLAQALHRMDTLGVPSAPTHTPWEQWRRTA